MKSFLLTVFGFFFLHTILLAQNKPITGVVKDVNNQPVQGATVGFKSTNVATTTRPDGTFSLQATEGRSNILVVSYVGMETQEVSVDGRDFVNITLQKSYSSLDEVVVVGYGSVKKGDLTGAIQQIGSDDIMREGPKNIVEALQGKLAGVNVTRNDGAPGAGLSIRIRGSNSFLGGTEPLYVVDGIPMSNSNSEATPESIGEDEMQTINALSYIDPNDIESITVLKDASATAIYGSRGANGVVMITTKKGQIGREKVQFNADLGVAEVSKRLKPLNAYDYANFENLAYTNANLYNGANLQIPYPGEDRPDPKNPGQTYYAKGPDDYIGGGTDWQDKIFRSGLSQNYTIGISGGNSQGNHYLSFGYLNQEGTVINSSYERYKLSLNLNRNVNKIISVGTSNSVSVTGTNGVKTGTDKSDAASAGVIRSVLTFPTTRITNEPYSEGEYEGFITNPVIYAGEVMNSVKGMNIFSSSFVEVKILPELKLRERIGFNYSDNRRDQYYPRTVYEGYTAQGRALKAGSLWQDIVSETMLTFDKNIADHQINVVAAGTFERTNSQWNRIEARTFPNDLLKNENMEAGEQIMPLKGTRSQSTLISYLGRVNYSFKDKYLLTASLRADGSSKFGEQNKWAAFTSAALAWKVSSESFMLNQKFFDDLKLRVSMGQTGNQGIGSYASLSKLVVYNYPLNGTVQTGIADDAFAGPANPNLKWETTTAYNVGVDALMLDKRLSLTIDLYRKETINLLQFITTPSSTGFTRQLRNSGSVENKGIEILLGGTPVLTKDFEWSGSFNISFNKNKILRLGSGLKEQYANNISTGDAPFIQIPGYSIGTLYGYVEDGFYDNEAEVRHDPVYSGEAQNIILRMIGEVKYKNLDDDPTSISLSDRTIIGDVNPKYTFGFTNNFSYKNWNLNVFINGVQGNDIINMNKRFNANLGTIKNITEEMYAGAWQYGADNTNASWPKIMRQYWREIKFTRRFIEDGSFVRLKNVSLGYNFRNVSKWMSDLSVSAGVTNLLTITNYSGFDPEVNSYGDNPALFGVDLGGYPNSRSYNLSIKCSF